MQLRYLLALSALSSAALAHAEPAAGVFSLSPQTEAPVAQPTSIVDQYLKPKRYNRSLNFQKRATTTDDTTTTTDAATTTADSTTSTSSSTTEATTTSDTSTTSATTTATTATSTSSSSSSTTSSSSSQSTTSATSTTQSTTTTSTTTGTTTSATSTVSAAQKEYNHRGEIAAIVTFSILIFIFLALTFFLCFREKAKTNRLAKKADAGADYSMVPLADGRPQSEAKFDRASMMFASNSQLNLDQMARRPTSMAASETLSVPMNRTAPGTPSDEHRANMV
ncbi:hypothetical protein BO85DRAFT_494936 [Aspergillus piperis CBS 112811]|uniref:Cell wall protein DAN4 n=1 Tax=Aspergillus piperis CBS 112811 TaxID=1448313 RepID=A0A8G1RDH2_9EURO|nr:hypothetical protein BO85DRAFT_494936 [Aspergillus piperis CBS 112811]RAH63196.1 hypothetical protein BO85DRAFT_494936 [Aspergillus piperis CBS 112811]